MPFKKKLNEIKKKLLKTRILKFKPFGVNFRRSRSTPNLGIEIQRSYQHDVLNSAHEQEELHYPIEEYPESLLENSLDSGDIFLNIDDKSDKLTLPGSRLNPSSLHLNRVSSRVKRNSLSRLSRTNLDKSNNSSHAKTTETIQPLGKSLSDHNTSEERKHTYKEEELYLKYIPVLDEYGDFYPKSQLDREFPACWLATQSWYLKYRSQLSKEMRSKKNNKFPRSKSECSLSEGTSRDDHSIIPDFNVSFSGTTSIGSPNKRELNPKNGVNAEIITLHPRYNEILNQRYCSIASVANFVDLKPFDVDFVFEQKDDSHLRAIKAQLLTSCLKSFFFPCKQTSVHITPKLSDKYKHLFSGIRIWDQVDRIEKSNYPIKAILFVSERASVILRHKDLCFLDALCVVAGISRDELLVLHDKHKDDWISGIDESGTVNSLFGKSC